MNRFLNTLCLQIGKRRYLKKPLGAILPEIAYLDVVSSFRVFMSLKDITGPSFYINFGGPAAFYHYEEIEKAEILREFPSEGVFLDVGANIGLFSLFLSRYFPNATCFAFEPHPLLQNCLESTIQRNKLGKVHLVRRAVSDECGSVELITHSRDSGGHSIIADSLSEKDKAKETETVQTTTLDTFATESQLSRVDFIKIDVQDAEEKVIQGARSLIERFQPKILMECNNQLLLQENSLLVNAFGTQYQFRIAGRMGLSSMKDWRKVAAEELKRGVLYTNYVLIPK